MHHRGEAPSQPPSLVDAAFWWVFLFLPVLLVSNWKIRAVSRTGHGPLQRVEIGQVQTEPPPPTHTHTHALLCVCGLGGSILLAGVLVLLVIGLPAWWAGKQAKNRHPQARARLLCNKEAYPMGVGGSYTHKKPKAGKRKFSSRQASARARCFSS